MKKHPSFFTYYTGDTKTLLVEIPLSSLGKDNGTLVLVSATKLREQDAPGSGSSDLSLDVTSTAENAVRFDLSADGKTIDVIQAEQGYRTTNEENKLAMERGAWDPWVTSLPILAINKAGKSVFVDASIMLSCGFFVLGFKKPSPEARMSLSECRSFPKNMYIIVDYPHVRYRL